MRHRKYILSSPCKTSPSRGRMRNFTRSTSWRKTKFRSLNRWSSRWSEGDMMEHYYEATTRIQKTIPATLYHYCPTAKLHFLLEPGADLCCRYLTCQGDKEEYRFGASLYSQQRPSIQIGWRCYRNKPRWEYRMCWNENGWPHNPLDVFIDRTNRF